MNPALRNRLVAIVGVVAAAVLMKVVPANEGTVYKTYRDIGGVLTYCTGATEDAIWGKTYTPNECAAKLDADLARHAEGVMGCVHVPLTDGQKVAFVDTAYNIGVEAFCSSSMARKANAGDMAGACAALSLWVNVKGKVVRGLVARRQIARAFCEGRQV
ncbi:lysozyme [Cupriavidus necator]|uniref:lysozyme n=1 Tax=Cupriavidus necator TaxID=106590 RepID=UPI0005B41B40|nr:lysozyme [Cupriavidus necator]